MQQQFVESCLGQVHIFLILLLTKADGKRNAGDIQFDGFEDIESAKDEPKAQVNITEVKEDNDVTVESAISFFESIESISTDEEVEKPKKKGLFGKWK